MQNSFHEVVHLCVLQCSALCCSVLQCVKALHIICVLQETSSKRSRAQVVHLSCGYTGLFLQIYRALMLSIGRYAMIHWAFLCLQIPSSFADTDTRLVCGYSTQLCTCVGEIAGAIGSPFAPLLMTENRLWTSESSSCTCNLVHRSLMSATVTVCELGLCVCVCM